jgi:membrane protein
MPAWLRTRLNQLHRTWLAWRHNDDNLTAASMAYYAVLSFFPLLLFLIAVFGFVLQFSSGAQDAQTQLLRLMAENTSPALAKHVRTALAEVQSNAVIGGPLGLLALLVAAVGIFTQLDVAMNRIWATAPPRGRTFFRAVRDALAHRLRAFSILMFLGLLIGLAFVADTVASAVRPWVAGFEGGQLLWSLAHIAASLVVNSILLTLIYKMLPRTRVRWRPAARGGIFAAVLWEITRQVLGFLLLGKKYTAYGVVGSIMAVMLWIYLASCIFFFAAEYVRIIQRESGDRSP